MQYQTSRTLQRSHKMRFGAEVREGATRFKLWAPQCKSIQLRIKGRRKLLEMEARDDGWHRLVVDGVGAGARYGFVLPDGTEIPDPASRYQPDDLHGLSEVVDPGAYAWADGQWSGRPWEEAVIYELHIGSFTKAGTFRAAMDKLDHLVDLGVSALQIMPLADFFGKFNWGYDGAMWFAPDASYGRPEDLKALVDAAHARGLMVFLDLVLNHLGPYGNHLPKLGPVFTSRHSSPWGEALNFDGRDAAQVRELAVELAIYWVCEFRFDGLRLDAVHEIHDDSPSHILELLAARVRAATPGRQVHLIIENNNNEERWLRRSSGLVPVHYTAQWNDDVHHLLHGAGTGENTGYYADFDNLADRCDKLGRALAEGFAYQGEYRPTKKRHLGEASQGLPPTSFVAFMQNHDQIGNRIKGDRITELAHADAVSALASIYLLLPQIPMLFMGEEWAATTPFPFFSDIPPEDRDMVREGRQAELRRTPEYDDPTKPDVTEAVDPTSIATFRSAKLDWAEPGRKVHAEWLAFYRRLIDLRHREIVPRLIEIEGFSGRYDILGRKAFLICWQMGDGSTLRLYANLDAERQTDVPAVIGRVLHQQGFAEAGVLGPWSVLWTLDLS